LSNLYFEVPIGVNNSSFSANSAFGAPEPTLPYGVNRLLCGPPAHHPQQPVSSGFHQLVHQPVLQPVIQPVHQPAFVQQGFGGPPQSYGGVAVVSSPTSFSEAAPVHRQPIVSTTDGQKHPLVNGSAMVDKRYDVEDSDEDAVNDCVSVSGGDPVEEVMDSVKPKSLPVRPATKEGDNLTAPNENRMRSSVEDEKIDESQRRDKRIDHDSSPMECTTDHGKVN
jgi:hypothetical protein